MGLTVTEDTPADMLAGNMELLVQLPPRIDEDYDNDDVYDRDEDDHLHQQHRNHHRHHNHHHNNGHHQRRTVNGNARRVTVARSTPMMDLLVQVATSQKLSASSYTLEAIGEHGLVLTHHPNTPIGALDALQVKLLPKQGTFLPMKTRHVNQPFEQTFRLQVHLPRNQLYVSRVSSRMNLGKILDDVCREKNLDRNNYELCHPANIEETLDLSLSLQDYHLQEVTLCPKRRSLGSSLSSQDIMALQRQEERRRQDAKQSVFGFAFKKSKESSLSTDSLGERSVSPARSDGTGRSASPQAPTAPTRPQRKRRPAPKPPMPRNQSEQNGEQIANGLKETGRDTQKERENAERIIVISHSRNSSDSSGYHEASVLSDNLDSNIRVPETLPRRSRLQITPQESSGRTLAESSQASKSLGNLAAVPTQRATIARGTSNSSLISAGLRKKKAAPAPPQPSRPLSSAISTQALERIVDSEESLTSVSESFTVKSSPDLDMASKINSIVPQMSLGSENEGPIVIEKIEMNFEEKNERRKSTDDSLGLDNSELDASSTDPSISNSEIAEVAIIPNVDPASEHKRGSGNDRSTLSTMPINKSEEETTSDLLKKVSDTLSGSLRSPVPLDGATSSLANEHQINAHCLDQPKSGDGKLQQRVNEARQLSEVNENTEYTSNERTSIDTVPSNFLNNRQPPTIKDSTTSDQKQNTYSKDVHPSSTTTDWEYLLPEPPTAFRDTNVVENREVLSSKTLLVSENVALNSKTGENREEKSAPRITEKAKTKVTEIVVTNGASLVANIRNDETGHRSRTTSVSSSEIGSELAIDRIRLSRSGIKSSIDTESRRGSQASSTPTVAPVDNTLSNFVITTYSRPKNVDIFNEIEQRTRDPQVETNRKNSASNSVPISGFTDSRKSSVVSLLKDHSQPRNFGDEKSGAILAGQKFSQTEIIAKGNDLHSNSNLERNETNDSDNDLRNTLSRSNIKISIATKPRPRGDSINENQRPKKPVFVNIGSDESSNSREDIKPAEETSREPVPGCNKKLSHWKENILNKQETPSATEKPLQSSQVLKNILPQLDSIRRNSDDSNTVEKANSIPKSEETNRVVAPLRNNDDTPAETNIQQNSTVSSSNELRAKRYTYAGPPAINLGSWSDRSRTTLVQIKPDNDYKVEKNRTHEAAGGLQKIPSFKKEENNTAVKKIVVTNSVTAIKNLQPTISTRVEKENAIDNRDKTEPNELAKTLIARTTATGFKRPVSMIVQSSGTMIRLKKEEEDNIEHKINGERNTQRKFEGGINGGIWRDKISAKKDEDEEERDDRPRNFKELKEAFAKDQNANSISMPKYGTYGRRSDNSTTKSTVRRESNISLNGDDENTLRKEIPVENFRVNKSMVSVQDKRNFVVIPQSINRNGIQDSVKRPSRGNLMPVVKGFKVAVTPEDEATFSQDKRPGFNRIAIGDISNANYMIPSQNGLRKTTQIKLDDSSSGIPKPPPTMPVITGVTLKSINHKNFRPKSMPAEPDTRNQLLESIRNFGGQNQLRRAPRRNTNIVRS